MKCLLCISYSCQDSFCWPGQHCAHFYFTQLWFTHFYLLQMHEYQHHQPNHSHNFSEIQLEWGYIICTIIICELNNIYTNEGKPFFKNILQKYMTKNKPSVVNKLTLVNSLNCSCNFSVSMKLCQNIKEKITLKLNLPFHQMSIGLEWGKIGYETLLTLSSEHEHHTILSMTLVF